MRMAGRSDARLGLGSLPWCPLRLVAKSLVLKTREVRRGQDGFQCGAGVRWPGCGVEQHGEHHARPGHRIGRMVGDDGAVGAQGLGACPSNSGEDAAM